jgi:H+/Cl- antiporter ClcA
MITSTKTNASTKTSGNNGWSGTFNASVNLSGGNREVLLLIAEGILAGCICGLTLWASESLSLDMYGLIVNVDGLIYPGGYFLSAIGLAIGSAIIVKHFCRQASGSGLPECKSILSANQMNPEERERLVSTRVFAAKVVGLILATGSGLSIGTEGPMVHIASCVAQFLMTHFWIFGDISESPSLSKQIFASAAAVGVSSAFNAPVGGLLFSVEITSTFYLISNYWKSFVAAG